MFCKNCGGKLNEDSKFCLNCGATLEASATVEPTSQATVKTKTPTWVIALIIALAIAVVGVGGYVVYDLFIAEDSYSVSNDNDDESSSSKTSSGDTSSDDTSSDDTSSDDTSSDNSSLDNNSSNNASSDKTTSRIPVVATRTPNSNYTALFTSNKIKENRLPAIFNTMDNNSYAHRVDNSVLGAIETIDAGYKNNKLVCMTNTVYFSYDYIKEVQGKSTLTAQDKETIFAGWRQACAVYDSWSFCELKCVDTGDTLQLILSYTDLEDSDNLNTLFNASYGSLTSEEYLELLSGYGYIAKYID